VAEYTLDEMREQAVKAARYFGRGMEGFDRTFLSVRSGEVVIVVARGSSAEKLAKFVEKGGLGKVAAGVEDVQPPAEPAQPQTESSERASSASASSGTTGPAPGSDPAKPVLIAVYHAPKEEFARKGGNIHLHVLSDAKLGRRERKTGECLCQKKRGSKERVPQPGQTRMCAECVKVAEDNGLAWTL
jgi:hypothetical protein